MLKQQFSSRFDIVGIMVDLQTIFWVVIVIISSLIIGSIYFLRKGLQNPTRVSQLHTGIGFCLIFFVFAFLFFVTTLDGFSIIASTILFIACVVVTILSIIIIWKKPTNNHKSFRLLLIVGYILGFSVSIFFGYLFTPTQRIERDGQSVIRALDEYHYRQGIYPGSLADLESFSTNQFVKTPSSLWGWLYTATDDDFSLGFIRDVDKFGYWICLYSSNTRRWDCVPEAQTPFRPDPTPGVYATEPFPSLH